MSPIEKCRPSLRWSVAGSASACGMPPLKALRMSVFEMKKVQSLALIAMLLALRVVLGMFANATLPFFGNQVKFGASFLPIAVTGAMFGPVPGLLVGALGDVLSFMIAPMGAYIPGFTISGALTGLIYGFFLYKNQITVPRVAVAWGVNMITVETFLAAFWFFIFMNPSYATPYTTFLLTRFISVAVRAVPEMVLLFAVGKLIGTAERSLARKTRA